MAVFTIIVWTLFGLVAGGMLGGALADLGAGHRGDIGALFVGLLMGALFGAGGGGALGLTLTRKFAGQKRKLELLAAGSVIGIVLVVLGVIIFETSRESRAQQARLPESLVVRYEIRLPPGMSVNPEHMTLELRTSVGVEPPYPYQQRPPVAQEDGRTVIRSSFMFHKAAADRTVALRPAFQQPAYLFTLRLPERPQPGGPNHGLATRRSGGRGRVVQRGAPGAARRAA
jgi:hypothetical protein